MPFLQLKPAEQLFLKMARDLMQLDAIVLCEGTRDAELLKLVAGEPGMRLGVTDCGGIREVYEVGRYVAALARLSRRLKSLGVLVNADEYEPAERASGLIRSLREHELETGELERISEGLFKAHVEGRPLIICVAGRMDLPVDGHCIEDHVLTALVLAGELSLNDVRRVSEELRQVALIRQASPRVNAKDVLEVMGLDPVAEIRRLIASRPEEVRSAFRRLVKLVEELQRACSH